MNRQLDVSYLGLRPYRPVWELQKRLHRELLEGAGRETLVLCEHQPVITLGSSAKESSFLVSRDELAQSGVEVVEVERGGDVTYHGPGQLVAYPMIDLKGHRRDVGWYMRSLEQCVIELAAEHGVEGYRIDGRTGVWVRDDPPRKIASLGVKLSRWVSYHGVAVNILDNRTGFSPILPCGLVDIETTSLERELVERGEFAGPQLGGQAVAARFAEIFARIFNYATCVGRPEL